MAKFLDVSVDFLLGNTDNPQSHKNPEDLKKALIRVNEIYKQASVAADQILAAQNIQIPETKVETVQPSEDGTPLDEELEESKRKIITPEHYSTVMFGGL